MDLSFFPLTLDAIDQAAAESLCLFIASDERPLTGLAGLTDWRLSGRLSKLLRSGLLSGAEGEAVLTPAGARLGFQKLFLFGLGTSDQSDEALVERVAEALRKIANAGVREAAMQLPARLSAEVGVRTLIDELQGPEKALLFAADPQRLVSALSHAARSVPPEARSTVKLPTSPALQPVKVTPSVRVQQQLPTPPDVPKAAPLPAAPSPPPVPEVPKAAPLPDAPLADVPIAPVAEPTPPPPVQSTESASPPSHHRPPPPPPQRYVPPPHKPSVFERKKKKP
jgi:hypothetical protein